VVWQRLAAFGAPAVGRRRHLVCARRGTVGGLGGGWRVFARMVPLRQGAVVRMRDDFSRWNAVL